MKNTLNQNNLRPRRILSISAGNTIQFTGIVLGSALFWISGQPIRTGIRILAMIAGYLLIYFNSHSLAHYAVGKLVGLRFSHYSIGGSSHASSYPPIMRAIFERLPFFAVHTNPVSMKAARPYAKALMFTAGITNTVILCTAVALFAYCANTPGGFALLVFNIIWQVSSLIAEIRSSGDLGKAFNAIKNK
jgi:ACR3 family arsenite efflux pump ArsB